MFFAQKLNYGVKNLAKKNTKAIDRAYEKWKDEIELLWHRSWFFWGFIAVAFAGYAYFFLPVNRDYQLALLFAGFGFFCSVIWTAVNRSSKYWQEYWEKQIMKLGGWGSFQESKKVCASERGLLSAKRFSPSRLMIALSYYINAAWGVILLITSWLVISGTCPDVNLMKWGSIAAMSITVIYAVWVYSESSKNYD